jgi:hypothetical protein
MDNVRRPAVDFGAPSAVYRLVEDGPEHIELPAYVPRTSLPRPFRYQALDIPLSD